MKGIHALAMLDDLVIGLDGTKNVFDPIAQGPPLVEEESYPLEGGIHPWHCPCR